MCGPNNQYFFIFHFLSFIYLFFVLSFEPGWFQIIIGVHSIYFDNFYTFLLPALKLKEGVQFSKLQIHPSTCPLCSLREGRIYHLVPIKKPVMLWANAAEDLPYEGHTCQQNSPMLDYKPWHKIICFRSLRPPPNFIYS